LNETVNDLDKLKKDHAQLEVQNNTLSKELTIVKSDRPSWNKSFTLSLTWFDPVVLVNKDQVDILASLRESVNEDKVALEEDVARLQQQVKEAAERNKMQLEQINSLLFEKVNLQSEGINQREKMLQRERDFGCVSIFHVRWFSRSIEWTPFSELRSSMSGKGVPEDVKTRVLGLHEDNVQLREQLKTVQDKLTKARTVRDFLFFMPFFPFLIAL
jgi:protein HOOK3